MSLLIPHLNFFAFDGFSRIQVCLYPLPLIFMNRPNTSKLIVIFFVIILSMVLFGCFQSPLKISLQISSQSHILKDVFMLWLTNSIWYPIDHQFEGGLLCVIWALGHFSCLAQPEYLYCTYNTIVLHSYAFYIRHSYIFYSLRNTIQLIQYL